MPPPFRLECGHKNLPSLIQESHLSPELLTRKKWFLSFYAKMKYDKTSTGQVK